MLRYATQSSRRSEDPGCPRSSARNTASSLQRGVYYGHLAKRGGTFPLRLAAAATARRDGVAAAAAAGAAQVGQQYFLKAACVDSWTV